uniref:hypothetical protein n=1 Tax=Acinetobacter soli TaxID=487316 RepID=UPI00148F0F7C
DHLSYKLVRELRSILKEYSLDLKIERNFPLADRELILNNIKQLEKWDENFLSLILFNSDLVEISLDGVEENFFELGAFFRLLGLHDLGISSLLIFNKPVTSSQDIRVILFKSLAKLAGLDYKVLQKQAKKLLFKLKTNGVYTSIFEDIPDVDIIIDHSKSNLTIDILPTICNSPQLKRTLLN